MNDWDRIISVRQNHICETESYLWDRIISVRQNHICETESNLWDRIKSVRQNHICETESYLWDRIISVRQNQIFLFDLHNGVTWLVIVGEVVTTRQYSLYSYRNIYPRVTVSLNHFLITAEHQCNAQYKPHESPYQSRNGIVTIGLFSLRC